MTDIEKLCGREIARLNNERSKLEYESANRLLTSSEMQSLNNIYNDLDFYNYHKNYRSYQRMLTEDIYDE